VGYRNKYNRDLVAVWILLKIIQNGSFLPNSRHHSLLSFGN
jgi:hypothetical protein